MPSTYFYPKKQFSAREVESIRICFRNGDHFTIQRNEIEKIDLRLYDRLIRSSENACPAAATGSIKLKILEKSKGYTDCSVFNPTSYRKNRKKYIEERLTSESPSHLVFADEYNWSVALFGDCFGEMEGEFLVLRYRENAVYGPFDGERHEIELGQITKEMIRKISIYFENCEYFSIFQEDISDIELYFDERLCWGGHYGYTRALRRGLLRISLDPTISYRDLDLYGTENRSPKQRIKAMKRRLCGAKGASEIDICILNFHLNGGYSNGTDQEHIKVPDIRPDEYFDALDEDEEDDFSYISGYAIAEKGGGILIRFGGEWKDETSI